MEQAVTPQRSLKSHIKRRFPSIRENSKLIAQFLFTVFIIAIGAWFLKHEKSELGEIKRVLLSSRLQYVILGITVTAIYIGMQGFLYKMAFSSIRSKVPLRLTILLFLKRNLISIFMPAGGVTSLAFFTDDIEKRGTSKTKILFA